MTKRYRTPLRSLTSNPVVQASGVQVRTASVFNPILTVAGWSAKHRFRMNILTSGSRDVKLTSNAAMCVFEHVRRKASAIAGLETDWIQTEPNLFLVDDFTLRPRSDIATGPCYEHSCDSVIEAQSV